MFFIRRKSQIEFLCLPEDKGVIAEPVPAKACLPEWFRRIPAVDKDHLTPSNNGLTVKRCMPFLDALSVGWIIPLAATVRLEIKDGGSTVNAGWEFDRGMVGTTDRSKSPEIRASRVIRASFITTGRFERRRAGAACSCRH